MDPADPGGEVLVPHCPSGRCAAGVVVVCGRRDRAAVLVSTLQISACSKGCAVAVREPDGHLVGVDDACADLRSICRVPPSQIRWRLQSRFGRWMGMGSV